MEPIYRFHHLDIARCFPTDATDWRRYEPFVPARGRQGLVASAVLSEGEVSPPMQINSCATGVLYVCVLHAPLFRAVPPGKLCNVLDLDSQCPPYREFVCADWAALIDTLVDIFAAHEAQTLRYRLGYATNQHRISEAILTLCDVYKDLLARYKTPGGRWRPWTPKAGRVSDAAVEQALDVFERLAQVMYGGEMDPPYTFIPLPNLRRLMQRLDDALLRLGPQRRPGHQYVQAARHAAVFHLLEHFGLVEPRVSKKGQRWVSDILRP